MHLLAVREEELMLLKKIMKVTITIRLILKKMTMTKVTMIIRLILKKKTKVTKTIRSKY